MRALYFTLDIGQRNQWSAALPWRNCWRYCGCRLRKYTNPQFGQRRVLALQGGWKIPEVHLHQQFRDAIVEVQRDLRDRMLQRWNPRRRDSDLEFHIPQAIAHASQHHASLAKTGSLR